MIMKRITMPAHTIWFLNISISQNLPVRCECECPTINGPFGVVFATRYFQCHECVNAACSKITQRPAFFVTSFR